MRTIEIGIYKYDELSEAAQNRAINDEVELIVEITDPEKLHKNSNLYKAFKRCSELQTPWFLAEYIWDYCKKQIMEVIRGSEYYEDGRLYTPS